MSLVDTLRESFSGTRGKVLIIGGLALTGYLLWTRKGTGDTGTTGDAAEDPYSSTATGGGASPAVTSPTSGDASTGKPENNGEWLSQGVDLLGINGMGAADAYNALSLALAGEPLTTVQYNAVSLVVSRLGTPPDGMPPLAHAAPSTTTTPPTTTPAKLPRRSPPPVLTPSTPKAPTIPRRRT